MTMILQNAIGIISSNGSALLMGAWRQKRPGCGLQTAALAAEDARRYVPLTLYSRENDMLSAAIAVMSAGTVIRSVRFMQFRQKESRKRS